MKILLLTTRINLGGIGVYTTSLAKALKARQEEVIVASSGGELTDRLKKDGIEHIYLPIDTSADVGLHTAMSYFRLLHIIKEEGIQIIHAQTRVAQVIAYLLAKRTGVAFISTCHGFFKKRLGRRFLPCWGMRVVAISDAVREHLVNDMGVSKDKVRLVYNGIDLNRFSKHYSENDKSLIRKEYGIADIPTIGMISRFSVVKGHRYLLMAFAKLLKKTPNLQLLIVGDGPDRYIEGLKALADKLAIRERVVFHGLCRDTSIPLSIMDLFCHPSLQEGLGLAILEAMAMGLPVVASDVGGVYSLIKHRHNGILVPPKDADALAEAISEILSNKPMAEKMGSFSKRIARDRFALDRMAESLLKVYQEVIR